MKIEKRIINGIPATFIKTDKFKSVTVKLMFKRPVTKERFVTGNMINKILIRTCNKYKTRKELRTKILENYNCSYNFDFKKTGNYIINSYSFSSLEDSYTKEGNLKNVIDLFYEMVFNPNTDGQKFDTDEFELVKKKLISKVKSKTENAREYARELLFKQMDKDGALSIDMDLDILNSITNEELYKAYQDMINNSEVELIVIGNVSEKDDYYDRILSNLKSSHFDIPILSKVNSKSETKNEIKGYDGVQSIFMAGLTLNDLSEFERAFVVSIFNQILGGGASARLFTVVREQNSLAYFCNSRYVKGYDIIFIYAGIEAKNYEKTLGLVKQVLESMKNITKEELDRTKESILMSLKESMDYQSHYIDLYYNRKLYNEPQVEEMIDKFFSVTVDAVQKLFSKVKLTDTFLLKGDSKNEQD